MTRSRATAKAAGASFERLIADYLAARIDDRIDRRVKTGAKDRGDIGGLRHHGKRIVLECKNVTRWALASWLSQAEVERANDDALAGIVIAKRVGKGHPGDQVAIMTVDTLIALFMGQRIERD